MANSHGNYVISYGTYRFFEILPGALSWATILLMVVLSWLTPEYVAVFIILFDIYWLMKTVFFSLHLRVSFRMMRENLRVDWRKKLEHLEAERGARWRDVRHLVILPMYDEPYALVRESLETLARAEYPREFLLVVLATEERGRKRFPEIAEMARKIEEEFRSRFGAFLVTTHPEGLPGEIPGKGSNETWAAKRAKEELIDPRGLRYEDVLVSVFDVDTHVPPHYFGRLAHAFLTAAHPQRSSYQPVPLFTNNIYEAPALGRVISFSATFWHLMQQSRPERLTTFSSHSMPMKALIEIGYWQTDVVSEDSRIFWQCYLHYDGDWRVVPLFYPVHMDANVAPTFWRTLSNIYKQQRRWGWGAENIAYMFMGHPGKSKGLLTNKKIPLGWKWYWGFSITEGFHSWATNALLIFALGWLPLILGGQAFNLTLLSFSLPQITRWVMNLASIGIVSSAVLSIILLPPKPEWLKLWHYPLYFLQWILMPVTLIVFGAFPALEAQTRLMLGRRFRLGFWVTPKRRY
ncbi:MAG: glycosyltransferase family 2 protein [bacterium]|nr:glycosyltransferase family 2 protein [bacterium]